MGAGHQKEQVMIRSFNFSAPHHFSGEERGAGNGVNGSWLHEEVSIKIPKVEVWRASRLGTHTHARGGDTPTP